MATPLSRIARHIVAVLAGYLLFAVLSVALFALSGRDPHAVQDWAFIAFSTAYGILAATLAGYVAGMLGGGNPIAHARTLALGIAAVAIVSLLARSGAGVWTQVAAVFLFAPSAIVGGWLRGLTR
jgi:hypothetical protein